MKFLINTFFIEIAKNIAELWTAYAKASIITWLIKQKILMQDYTSVFCSMYLIYVNIAN